MGYIWSVHCSLQRRAMGGARRARTITGQTRKKRWTALDDIRCRHCRDIASIYSKNISHLTTSPILNTSRSLNEASASSSPSTMLSSAFIGREERKKTERKGEKQKEKKQENATPSRNVKKARKPVRAHKLQMGLLHCPAPPPKCNSQLKKERWMASL